ncbi:lysophospholipid acyltransferase family protein [Sphingomonas spermidinifaciens]|uniref:lysophospholipid acyltransferase family protein n=1 Tax=Sphingomonas spermidinifaciens TaxID=1141889 RepID=UPI001596E0C5|nr:lysophospholipid acyltransferase family protein [Sphingomonas spermidinifaciens]
MIGRIRSWLFDAAFYGGSVGFVLAAPVAALFSRRALLGVVMGWLRWHRFCANVIMGMRTQVEGAPLHRPGFYVAKHQAFYETFELALILGGPAIVMKAELASIPLWGWAARQYGVIVVDRSGSATALRQMLREAKAARAAGRSVLIFPEGTRVLPGEAPPVRAGFAALYKALSLPTVPVALDSARVWPRRGPKRPGVVTFRFGEPLDPALPREAAEARIHAGINALEPAARIG